MKASQSLEKELQRREQVCQAEDWALMAAENPWAVWSLPACRGKGQVRLCEGNVFPETQQHALCS